MLKHHRLDAILVLVACLQLLLLVVPFFVSISVKALICLTLLNVFLVGTNYQCVAHNFIHHPFFKNSWLNHLFSVLNTLVLGAPQSMYRVHHLNHHRHNNRPESDESSTFKHGIAGKEENIFAYSILGVIRMDLPGLYRAARKSSTLPLIEALALLSFVCFFANLNWKLFVAYVIGTYALGQVFALWQNYCEHHHADPYDRKRDSVSCYNPVYNFLWFNNGYHQEHHFSPQTHWTAIRSLRSELPVDRVIVKGCHLSNSF